MLRAGNKSMVMSAPRAASGEPRVAALIAGPAEWDPIARHIPALGSGCGPRPGLSPT
jgi:hypothetical protein